MTPALAALIRGALAGSAITALVGVVATLAGATGLWPQILGLTAGLALALVGIHVGNARERARMTEAERRAEDEDVAREFGRW